MRKLARIEHIESLQPIVGADAIEAAKVGGWTVVVKKGEFRVGDAAVYFEIDAFLRESDARFAFLMPRGVRTLATPDGDIRGHALRTAKLRGTVSQGLLLGLAALDLPVDLPRGTDVSEQLGVLKWEPPLPNLGSGDQAGPFPSHLISKSDAERVQNLSEVFEALRAHPAGFVATEKVDGTSLTVARDHDGTLLVASRNWLIRDGDNLYWKAVRDHKLDACVGNGEALQAEIYGEGVQGNPLAVVGRHIAVFAFVRDRKPVARNDWPLALRQLGTPLLPHIALAADVAGAVAQADGIRSVIAPAKLAEGIVWHAADGATFQQLEGRSVFKVISNQWLLKHDKN